MARGHRNIEPWEGALIKTMLADGAYTRDQIVAYFTRPDRTVNQFRINEIKDGKLYDDIPSADTTQLQAFLQTYQSPQEARHRFFDEGPIHPANLYSLFRLKDGTTDILHVDETDRIEFKQSLNFGSKAEYGRVIASFANAGGGFLVFGVEDSKKRVTGIKEGRLATYDSAKLNQYLAEHFAPVPIWEKTELSLAKKTIGIIYVRPARDKPIICTRDDASDLREAEIYYRYPGESRRIRHAELSQIVKEARRRNEEDWNQLLRRIQEAGVENAAILNTSTGEVTGKSGKFLLSEDLLPRIKFVSEGRFSVTEGDPTLRLIGDVEPVTVHKDRASESPVTKVHLTDADLTIDFLDQADVTEPVMYIRHLAYSAKLWLPLFYYIRQAEISEREAVQLLHDEVRAAKDRIAKITKRIESRSVPAGAPKVESVRDTRQAILKRSLAFPKDRNECLEFAKTVRTLGVGDIDFGFLLPLLKQCVESFPEAKTNEALRYAIAHVDVVLHKQIRAQDKKQPAKRSSR